jgi:DNA-binding transcriptional MocR family regulator
MLLDEPHSLPRSRRVSLRRPGHRCSSRPRSSCGRVTICAIFGAKRLYSAQRDALLKCLRPRAKDSVVGGLAVVLRLPDGAPDVSIAKETLTFGLAPTPLSLWYASRVSAQSGLLLGLATAPQKHLAAPCDRLYAIIGRCA